jgi:hypothetical protein
MATPPEKPESEPDASEPFDRADDLVAKSPRHPDDKTSPATDADMTAFAAERDAVLLACNVDRMLAFNARHRANPPKFVSREIAEVALHIARTEAKSLPIEARRLSKEWLSFRGYPSLDDGDL